MNELLLEIGKFALSVFKQEGCAVAISVEIRSGVARRVAQLVAAAEGRVCGYVFGGCIEEAVASQG